MISSRSTNGDTGLSDRISEPVTFETHAADLISILDVEQVDQAGLVGFSEGGIVALVTAALYPERVTSVVTQGPTKRNGADHASLVALADPDNLPPSPDEQADRYRSMIRGGPPRSPPRLSFLLRVRPRSLTCGSGTHGKNGNRPARGRCAIIFGPRPDSTVLPGTCGVSHLVVHAVGDQLNHVTHGRMLASLVPDAQLREFEGDAHFWSHADPS